MILVQNENYTMYKHEKRKQVMGEIWPFPFISKNGIGVRIKTVSKQGGQINFTCYCILLRKKRGGGLILQHNVKTAVNIECSGFRVEFFFAKLIGIAMFGAK